MTTRSKWLLIGSAVMALAAGPALAESYKFTLHNKSQYRISGFETLEDGTWSKWTGVKAGSGESIEMDWQSNSGNCTVPFRIIYRDIETEQYVVDWCKISNIYVTDDKVTAD